MIVDIWGGRIDVALWRAQSHTTVSIEDCRVCQWHNFALLKDKVYVVQAIEASHCEERSRIRLSNDRVIVDSLSYSAHPAALPPMHELLLPLLG